MIRVTDCGEYFRVVYDGIETCTVGKHPNGFATKEELLAYLEAWVDPSGVIPAGWRMRPNGEVGRVISMTEKHD